MHSPSVVQCNITQDMVLAAFWDTDINPCKLSAEFNKFFELPAWERLFETMGLKLIDQSVLAPIESIRKVFFVDGAWTETASCEVAIPLSMVKEVPPVCLNTSKSAHMTHWARLR